MKTSWIVDAHEKTERDQKVILKNSFENNLKSVMREIADFGSRNISYTKFMV